VDAEEAESEPHAAVACTVDTVDQADQSLGCEQHRLVVGLVAAEGDHEDHLRIGREREAQKAGPALPLEPVRLVPVAAHAGLADGSGVEHQEPVTAQCRLRLVRTMGGDDLEASGYLPQHGDVEPAVLVADEARHPMQLADDRRQQQ